MHLLERVKKEKRRLGAEPGKEIRRRNFVQKERAQHSQRELVDESLVAADQVRSGSTVPGPWKMS